MPVRARFLGIVLGLFVAAAVVALLKPQARRAQGMVLSECDGRITAIAIQYTEGSVFALPVYRDFLRQLPSDVKVIALCPTRKEFDSMQRDVDRPLTAVITGHPITCWSRDRWLGITSPERTVELLCPQEETAGEIWPERRGDGDVAFDLEAAIEPRVTAARSELYFDGGDFIADGQTVFVTPAVMRKNLQRSVRSPAELEEALSRKLGKQIVFLNQAPDHHAGMYMALAGNRVAIVGDPSLGDPGKLPDADVTLATQRLFDCVAKQLGGEGYRVVRIPTVCGRDARTYLTYVNGIIDCLPEGRVVYMPVYEGAEAMNLAAQRVWEQLGYRVVRVNCTSVFPMFGTLHCLVNVVARS